MTGYPDATFRPDVTLNRAQALMAVWRSQGRPEAASDHPFVDAPDTAWYDAALDWAAEQEIVVGYPDATFRPAERLSRAQYAMMVWRLARRPAAAPSSFTDTESTQWFVEGMDWAAERGYMIGFPDGTFRADDPLTRAQGVMAFWRARQFDDVAPTEWFAPAVDWARYRGVVDGYEDHTYRPANDLNRAEIVMILHQTMDAPIGSPANGFADVDPSAWFVAGLDWAAAAGVVNGYPDGTYRAGDPVNRQQLVMMLWRLAGAPAVNGDHGLSDVPIGAWYTDGVTWAAQHSLLAGVVIDAFHGTWTANRAEVVALLANLAASPQAWSPAVTLPSTMVVL